MPKMARRIFAELRKRAEVHPIFWNDLAECYQELGAREHRLLGHAFALGHRAVARPEWYGENAPINFWRLLSRRRFSLETLGVDDVFFVPDIYRDQRVKRLVRFLGNTSGRAVAIFHDAADLRLPALHRGTEEKVRRYVESLALFDRVICISEESRRDLISFWQKYGSVAAETTVELWPADTGPDSEGDADMPKPVVLFVSSFTPRKNHLTLLEATESLWRRGLAFELRLIGRSAGPFFNKVEARVRTLEKQGRPIRWLRHINDTALFEEYRACRFTVYPSLMEGFGLPIVESLVHSKPCICGGNGALGEVARGGGCLIVDQTSVDELALAIEQLLQDRQLYARLSSEAGARRFRSWVDYIDKLSGHLEAQPLASSH